MHRQLFQCRRPAEARPRAGEDRICTDGEGRIKDHKRFPQHSFLRGPQPVRTVDTRTANQMWGGRFAEGPDAIMQAINASIGFDKRLYAQDIAGSRAHAAMLAATGI